MKKLYRGKILNPISASECEFFADGGILVDENGRIESYGKFEKLNKGEDIEVQDFSEDLIIPAFSDVHTHLPQYDVRGKFSGNDLLPWLRNYIWPEEIKFASSDYAKKVARRFFDDLIQHGTLTAGIFGTIHVNAAREMFNECNIRAIIGKAMMDQNSPAELTENTQDSLEGVDDLCEEFGQKHAITPRFAMTCSNELMCGGAALANKYGAIIQTHLSENYEVIDMTSKLFPNAENYTDIYLKAGLLGPKTIVAHAIHCSDEEFDVLKKTGTKIAHCPTSNIALNSGRMPVEKVFNKGIEFALATDVGAGPKTSMLDVMRGFLEAHAGIDACEYVVNEVSALYYATLAGAKILGFGAETGNFKEGKSADFLVLKTNFKSAKPKEIIHNLCYDIDYSSVVQKTVFRGEVIYEG
ncbi:amidohydrolase family protein [Patescibacteria group bacterium]|nr:amidohydrolase family protein [Patescibacteria group bacterium]